MLNPSKDLPALFADLSFVKVLLQLVLPCGTVYYALWNGSNFWVTWMKFWSTLRACYSTKWWCKFVIKLSTFLFSVLPVTLAIEQKQLPVSKYYNLVFRKYFGNTHPIAFLGCSACKSASDIQISLEKHVWLCTLIHHCKIKVYYWSCLPNCH